MKFFKTKIDMALVSNCCGAYSEYAGDIDLCTECMEHCDFVDDEGDC
jgi:hypothetical protein